MIRLTTQGGISLKGGAEAVKRCSAALRDCKAELIAQLSSNDALRHWTVHYADRDPTEHVYCPPVTIGEVLMDFPDALAAEPYKPPPNPADDPAQDDWPDILTTEGFRRYLEATEQEIDTTDDESAQIDTT